MSNPHEKLAMEFFSPPGPSAREWRFTSKHSNTFGEWIDGATCPWPSWSRIAKYEIRLKPRLRTLPERQIPEPVWEPVKDEHYWVADPLSLTWARQICFKPDYWHHVTAAERGFCYPDADQGRVDAITAAKAMCGWAEQPE